MFNRYNDNHIYLFIYNIYNTNAYTYVTPKS